MLVIVAAGCAEDPPQGPGLADPSATGPVSPTAGNPSADGLAGSNAPVPGTNNPVADPGNGAPSTPTDGLPPVVTDNQAMDMPAEMPADERPALALDECGLDTGFVGDEQCILPPPPGEGFQMHIGPEDYDNPDPRYILGPGEEITNNFVVTAPNKEQVYFYYRQYRLRPSSHHMIITTGSGLAGGRRVGTANLSQDNPAGGIIAPENQGVGIALDANSNLSVSLHSINVTDKPALREVWVNFWYRDPAEVTEPTNQLFQIGSASFAVQPGEDTILGPYSCDIPNDGRMLWFYGHRHASNVRFSAWRVRGGQRDLFYEGLEWEEPLLLEYSSLVENPVPDRDNHIEGGWSGILDLQAGDKLEWECHVVNHQDNVLRFTNETYAGEMCIMDGEMVGTNCGTVGGGGPPGGFSFP